MNNNTVNKIYDRMKNYSIVQDLAVDTPKIANLAYEEIIVSYLEGIYKFDGLNQFINKIKNEIDDSFRLKISMLILTADKSIVEETIKKLSNSEDTKVRLSALNLVGNINQDLIDSYTSILDKIRAERKI